MTRPRLSAGLGAQLFTDAGQRTLGPTLGVALSLPFTAGRANRASVAGAAADVVAAEAHLSATRNRIRGDVTAALARYRAAVDRLAVYDAGILRAAGLERQTALDAYASGELSLLELLDFERALARAETDRLHSLVDAARSYAALWSAGAGDREDWFDE